MSTRQNDCETFSGDTEASPPYDGHAGKYKMAGKKVIIKVESGHRYSSTTKDGMEFTSVNCMGATYGAGHPCDNEDEVQSAVKRCKKMVRENGDIPMVEDNRMTLDRFF